MHNEYIIIYNKFKINNISLFQNLLTFLKIYVIKFVIDIKYCFSLKRWLPYGRQQPKSFQSVVSHTIYK